MQANPFRRRLYPTMASSDKLRTLRGRAEWRHARRPTTTHRRRRPQPRRSLRLCDLTHGQEADFFALLSAKEELTTKDGKPYFRVAFRDAQREVSFPVWSRRPARRRVPRRVDRRRVLQAAGRSTAKPTSARSSKSAASARSIDGDAADGFDPAMCMPRSRREPAEMFDELRPLVVGHDRRQGGRRRGDDTARRQPRAAAQAARGDVQPPRLRRRVSWNTC